LLLRREKSFEKNPGFFCRGRVLKFGFFGAGGSLLLSGDSAVAGLGGAVLASMERFSTLLSCFRILFGGKGGSFSSSGGNGIVRIAGGAGGTGRSGVSGLLACEFTSTGS